MRFAVVYSLGDPVGVGVARVLRGLIGGVEASCAGSVVSCVRLSTGDFLAGYGVDQLFFEFLDSSPDPGADAVIVLSKHSSSSGRPSLTVHYTGNPTGDASLGGSPGVLSVAAALLGRELLRAYRDSARDLGLLGEYQLSFEATHHGPTGNRKPLVFVEVGSGPEQWADGRAHTAMARAVARVLEGKELLEAAECSVAAGFGGTHYPYKFTRLALEEGVCMGHMIPKYAFNRGVPRSVILQALEKNWPAPAATAVIEKKSIRSAHRRLVEEVAAEAGVRVEYV